MNGDPRSKGAWPRCRHGAFHEVLIGPEFVERRPVGSHAQQRAAREAMVHGVLPGQVGGVALPQLVSAPTVAEGQVGHSVRRVPGAPSEATWEQARGPIQVLLQHLHASHVPARLPGPRTWCGGARLRQVIEDGCGALLGDSLTTALELVGVIEEMPAPTRVFVHGDFGPHNLLWTDAEITGLVDLDHACAGDPAMDHAPLIGFFTAASVAEICDDATLTRAMQHRATLSLQVAAAAHLAALPALRDHAIGNFLRRHDDGTLHDPAGAKP